MSADRNVEAHPEPAGAEAHPEPAGAEGRAEPAEAEGPAAAATGPTGEGQSATRPVAPGHPEAEPGDGSWPGVDRRAVLRWEIGAFVVIMIGASALHFAFELSGFTEPVAVIASVNESTFEHLKLFFWPALLFALIEHAYMKDRCTNYWWGKALAMLATPLAIILSFYFYIGIAVPLTGRGSLPFDIGTGAFGVLVGNVVAYRVLTAPPKGRGYSAAGGAIIAVLAFLMATAAWLTPRFFLYENFFGYEYSGDYGILEDYTPYLVFDRQ